MLEDKGYPFKSKLHAKNVAQYQRSGMTGITVQKYVSSEYHNMYSCPYMLLYQFTDDFKLKVSIQCCTELKKKPLKAYEKESNRTMSIIGVRADEGGTRKYNYEHRGCVWRDKSREIYRFSPLSPCSDEFIDWYVETRNIKLCDLYYPPYNFKRTGCKGCPFNAKIGESLDLMKELLPAEYKQCWTIWKPVYDEYVRIGYRKVKPYEEPKKKEKEVNEYRSEES